MVRHDRHKKPRKTLCLIQLLEGESLSLFSAFLSLRVIRKWAPQYESKKVEIFLTTLTHRAANGPV